MHELCGQRAVGESKGELVDFGMGDECCTVAKDPWISTAGGGHGIYWHAKRKVAVPDEGYSKA